MIINLFEWDITYKEFVEWVLTNGADVNAIACYGSNDPTKKYMFEREEDLTAFKLAFHKKKGNSSHPVHL